MIDTDEIVERLGSYSETVKRKATSELRETLRSVEYLEVERDTYKEEALRLSQENARLTVALQGQTTTVYSELNPDSIEHFADMFDMRMKSDWLSGVTGVIVETDGGTQQFAEYDLYRSGVHTTLVDNGKTLMIFPQPKRGDDA